MHSAFDGADAVGVAMNTFVVSGVPLHRDVEHLPFVFIFVVSNLAEQSFLRSVQVLHEVDNAALVLERHVLRLAGALIFEHNFETTVQEGHCLQALKNCAGNKFSSFGSKDDLVGPEGH